eukprot:jgi/Mesvir1/16640/Mv10173-RA.1
MASLGMANAVAVLALAIAIAVHGAHAELDVKRIAGPPEEFYSPGQVGPYVVHSVTVRRLVEGGDVSIQPGGGLKSIVIFDRNGGKLGADVADALMLSLDGKSFASAASCDGVSMVRSPGGWLTLTFPRRSRTLSTFKRALIRLNAVRNGTVASSTRPFLVATGWADVTLAVSFAGSNFVAGSPVHMTVSATSGTTGETLVLSNVAVTATWAPKRGVGREVGGKVGKGAGGEGRDRSGGGGGTATSIPPTGPAAARSMSFSHLPSNAGTWRYLVEANGAGSWTGVFERSVAVSLNVGVSLGDVSSAFLTTAQENGEEYAVVWVSGLSPLLQPLRAVAYGELLGTDASPEAGGTVTPIAYAQHIANVTAREGTVGASGGWQAGLYLNLKWLKRLANVQGPYMLRNFALLALDGGYTRLTSLTQAAPGMPPPSTPITVYSSATAALLNARPSPPGSPPLPITEVMRMGHPPIQGVPPAVVPGQKIVLVGGYCAGDIWGPVVAQFTNAVYFRDLLQNRPNDEFARVLASFAERYERYALVAHSQGGMAALHLAAYYWSGLDRATNGTRRIQSVGTPYQGTPLMDDPILAEVFGCGYNGDLSTSGAPAWLASIPLWARSLVHYYTAAFGDPYCLDKVPFTDACAVMAESCDPRTAPFLLPSNDGVVEEVRGQLTGVNNEGHSRGECHSAGMNDPPEAWNRTRNAGMSFYARPSLGA